MGCPETDRTLAWIEGGPADAAVAAHLAGCAACAKLARDRKLGVRSTAVDSESDAPRIALGSGEPAQEPTCFSAGTFVGNRYRITKFIARGGMGEVYEAFDEELRVRVALKAATRTTGVALDRFRREVMLARRVTHRNVCRLFEIGFERVGDATVPYCTMELLEGTTLTERLARGPLAIDEARAIVEQVAAGLSAAHAVGVIHRDFKSNNILLVGDGRAVITDFGLARAEAGVAEHGHTLTTEQALLGTPAYMAPEQVECKAVSAATDVYALGIVMFEMVTGDLPFRAETPMATAILRLTSPVPSARARQPRVPVAWDRAITRCLALDPAARFTRATDVVAALDERAPRHGVLGAMIGAAALVALALGHGFAPLAEHARPETAPLPAAGSDGTRTVLVIDPAGGPAWRTTAAGELLRAELRVAGRVRAIDGDEAAHLAREVAIAPGARPTRDQLERLARLTSAQLVVIGALQADALALELVDLATGERVGADHTPVAGDDLASATGRLGDHLRRILAGGPVPLDADHAAKVLPPSAEAVRSYAEGLARARSLDHDAAIAALTRATELAPDFGLGFIALYGELASRRQHAKAADAARHAFELAGGLRSDQRLRAEAIYRESRKEWALAETLWSTLLAANPDDVRVAVALGHVFTVANQADQCYAALEQVRRRPAPIGDDPRLDLQETWCARAAGDFRRGLSAATRADVKAGVRGARDVQATALSLEGEMLANAGEYDRAIVVLERSQQLHTATRDQEGMLEATRQLAYVYWAQGDMPAAERTDREALALAKALHDRVAEGIILNDLGQVLPKAEDALRMFEDGLAIAREQGDERLITALLLNIANKQSAINRHPEAITTYREVIERAKAQHDDANLATAEMNMADTLTKLARRSEALPLYDQALASYRERGDEDGVGFALSSRGEARWQTGDLAGARADLEAAIALRTRLGEQHHLAHSQDSLARLELAEDHGDAAARLATAVLAQRRSEKDPEQIAAALILHAEVLVALGKPADALTELDEADHLVKPAPDSTGPVNPSDIAFVRGLADPVHAAAQLPAIRAAAHRENCPECELAAELREAELAHAAHAPNARELLDQVRRRAVAAHAGDVAARAAHLLAPVTP